MADYSCDLALKRIRRWILTSDLSSPGLLEPRRLPTRVIDVDPDSSSTDIRLMESKGRQARYIALSHRWGGSETPTTTSSTLNHRIAGINLNDLPKTFQDAVKIARFLYVRYLWIDSLCITQDDTNDWERESLKMADIFSNAYLVISASFSAGPSSGCLLGFDETARANYASPDERSVGLRISKASCPRIMQDAKSLNRTFLVYTPSSSTSIKNNKGPFMQMDAFYKHNMSQITITSEWMPSSFGKRPTRYLIPHFGRPVDPISGSELSHRGWILQERLLSHRTLHFCRDQMYLETNSDSSIRGEDGSKFFSGILAVLSSCNVKGSHGWIMGFLRMRACRLLRDTQL